MTLRRLGLLVSCSVVGGCLVAEARLRGTVAGSADSVVGSYDIAANNGASDGANDGVVGGVRRRRRRRSRSRRQQQQLWWTPTTPATVPTVVVDAAAAGSSSSTGGGATDGGDECAPQGFSGYHPAIGCRSYYWCQDGISSSARYECADGLVFDASMGICNWENAVACSRPDVVAAAAEAGTNSTDLAVAEAVADFQVVASAAPATSSSRKRATSRGGEVIGYWRSPPTPPTSRPVRMTSADAVDYAKLTRINFASYAVHPSGRVVASNANADGAINPDMELLLGPTIWEDSGDGRAKNYCWTGTLNVNCYMHDYRKGMLYLAHESGVQVYPSITLGEGATLSSIPADVFVANAVALMIDGGFDGIDLDLALSVGSPSRSTLLQAAEVDALRGILVALRTKIVELMVRDNRAYGLTMVMPCALHATPNLADALSLVDEVNLMTFDFNSPSRSERVVPISPLYSNPTVQGSAESVDSCVSDWTSAVMMGGTEGSGAVLARDRINVGLSFDGWVYHGAEALYGPHAGVEDDAKVPYYEVYRQLSDGSLFKGWDDVTKTMFGGSSRGELITYEDTMGVCWKTEYGIKSGVNGYFVW